MVLAAGGSKQNNLMYIWSPHLSCFIPGLAGKRAYYNFAAHSSIITISGTRLKATKIATEPNGANRNYAALSLCCMPRPGLANIY